MPRTVTGENAGAFGSYTTFNQLNVGAAFPTPAVPPSLAVVTNAAAVNATVTVSGGTGTNVAISGVLQGTFAGTYTVPPGGTIALTYTVAPTWTWSVPTVPPLTQPAVVTGTPVNNTSGVPVVVVVTGGTGTQVAINGVNQGTFDGTYTVPAGGNITLTYTVAPTWTWTVTTTLANPADRAMQVVITGGTMTNVSVNGATVGAGAGTYTVPLGGSITMTYTVNPTWVWSVAVTFLAALNANGTPLSVTGVS